MIRLQDISDNFGLEKIRGFSIPLLAGVLADSSKYYRSFQIEKRKGGLRRIDAPYPVLSEVQRTISKHIELETTASQHAFAYVPGRNFIEHARQHAGRDELLVVDLKDFFGSITRQMVQQTLADQTKLSDSAHALSIICTLGGSLPQGAPTSPTLSNLVFKQMDFRLSALASRLDLVYSRYADDLAFSGRKIPGNFPSYLGRILSSRGFSLNPSKTILKKLGAKKIVTGVSISRGVLKPPRSFVRSLRSEIHFIERRMSTVVEQRELDPFVYERAIGRLNYWLQIEPNNRFALEKKISLSLAHRRFLSLAMDNA